MPNTGIQPSQNQSLADAPSFLIDLIVSASTAQVCLLGKQLRKGGNTEVVHLPKYTEFCQKMK